MSAADDRDEIRALIHEYCYRLDAGDLDGVAALFEHGEMGATTHDRRRRGAAEVRHTFDGVELYDDGTPCTLHMIANTTIRFDGADAASSRSAFVVLQSRADFPLQPVLAGEYHDRFERADGAWRFAVRIVDPRRVGDLSGHMRAGQRAEPR